MKIIFRKGDLIVMDPCYPIFVFDIGSFNLRTGFSDFSLIPTVCFISTIKNYSDYG